MLDLRKELDTLTTLVLVTNRSPIQIVLAKFRSVCYHCSVKKFQINFRKYFLQKMKEIFPILFPFLVDFGT